MMKTNFHQNAAKQEVGYKFWPHADCVDNVFGDRNPVYSCAGMDNYS